MSGVHEALLQVTVFSTIVSQLLQQPANANLLPTFVGKHRHKLTIIISFEFVQTFNQNFILLAKHCY